MKQVPDRRKQRLEYLKRKAGVYTRVAVYAILCVVTFCMTAFVAILVLKAMRNGRLHSEDIGNVIGCASVVGFLSWYCLQSMRKSKREADAILYVPPVMADTLPAEEILVRGSEEPPVVQSEVLLRAAQQGQETPKEELLRVSQE